MVETRQIATIVILGLALGVVGIAVTTTLGGFGLSGPAVVSSYEAHIFPDGTLAESFTYTFTEGDQYRMLYRSWEVPVSLQPQGSPYIQPVSVTPPPDSVAYVKDRYGIVTILTPGADNPFIESTIDSLAEYNEAGCYYAPRFSVGSYDISYEWKLFPPIEYDSSYKHLNLMLASVHAPYQKVTVVIEDAAYISAVYAHPPSLKVTREGNHYVITGSAAEDELVEVELLMASGSDFPGFYSPVSDVKGKTESANFWYSLGYNAATWVGYASYAAVLVVPVLIYLIWSRHGREEDVTVPTYLSTVPNRKRKPWLVNLVFRKDVFDFDEDGFYATLLDMHMRKKIRLEPREGGMKIRVLDAQAEDKYEEKVIGFLQKNAVGDAFDTDTLKELAHDIKRGKGSYAHGMTVKNDLVRAYDGG